MTNVSTLPEDLASANFKRSSTQIASDMIYVSTKYSIPVTKITFGIPRVMDMRPDIDEDPNTAIVATIKKGFDARLEGERHFLYRRFPLDFTTQDESIYIIPPHFPYTVSDIVAGINESLSTSFVSTDFIDLTYSGAEDTITLIANPNSLAWTGSKTIKVVSSSEQTLITTTDLSGFTEYSGT